MLCHFLPISLGLLCIFAQVLLFFFNFNFSMLNSSLKFFYNSKKRGFNRTSLYDYVSNDPEALSSINSLLNDFEGLFKRSFALRFPPSRLHFFWLLPLLFFYAGFVCTLLVSKYFLILFIISLFFLIFGISFQCCLVPSMLEKSRGEMARVMGRHHRNLLEQSGIRSSFTFEHSHDLMFFVSFHFPFQLGVVNNSLSQNGENQEENRKRHFIPVDLVYLEPMNTLMGHDQSERSHNMENSSVMNIPVTHRHETDSFERHLARISLEYRDDPPLEKENNSEGSDHRMPRSPEQKNGERNPQLEASQYADESFGGNNEDEELEMPKHKEKPKEKKKSKPEDDLKMEIHSENSKFEVQESQIKLAPMTGREIVQNFFDQTLSTPFKHKINQEVHEETPPPGKSRPVELVFISSS